MGAIILVEICAVHGFWHKADMPVALRNVCFPGVKRTYSGQLAMSAYSLPEPTIGYARVAMLAVAFVSDIRQ
jgi:hypothetical protein